MWPQTKLASLLQIAYPIIQAPMAGGATTPELVAAVSNAGGLGSLGAGMMSPAAIKDAIIHIRSLTAKPFSVNLFTPQTYHLDAMLAQQLQSALIEIGQPFINSLPPLDPPYAESFEEQMAVILEARVPIFSFTFGIPEAGWLTQCKQNNIKIIGTATTLDEALALQQLGIDAIVAQGFEAGGHRGNFLQATENSLIGTMALIPMLADKVSCPIIAAGGIMDARGIIAANALGAAGVQMGTAFLTTHESGISSAYKQALLSATYDSTALTTALSGKFARGIRNELMTKLENKFTKFLDYPIQNKLTQPLRQAAAKQNNAEYISLWAGQGVAATQAIGAAELVNQLIKNVEHQ